MSDKIDGIRQQLNQLHAQFSSGAMPQEQYDAEKIVLERRLLDEVMAPSAPDVHAKYLFVGIALAVLALAFAGYWWTGARVPTSSGAAMPVMPTSPSMSGPSGGGAPTPAASAPHGTNTDQVASMTDRLAQRLKEQPQDAEGWAMLARSYSVLGRHPEALKAYEKAVALRKDDANLLADYADSLAVQNNRVLAGEPLKLVERALKLEPHNLKALSMAGSEAFDRQDYAKATRFWQQVVEFGPADSPMVQQIMPSLEQAQQLAGLPPRAKKPTLAGAVGATPGTVSGSVSLSPTLVTKVAPDDTVFIFARTTEGGRAPLAILRKKVRDLPIQFTLDDSHAMSPENRLSTANTVTVGARISKSGNAQPQAGDLSGLIAAVKVGASGLAIDINTLVKP